MTELHVPDYADLLRRAAANHAADATRYADREQKLTTELTRFEEWMHGEQTRIQGELEEARRKADLQLRAISEDWETRKREVQEVGRAKTEHQRHATGAERAWRNWCHDEGIDPASLPALPDTGPLPVVAAEPAPGPQVADLTPYVGQDVALHTFSGTKVPGHLLAVDDYVAQVRSPSGATCRVPLADVSEVARVAEIAPPPGFDPASTMTVTADPLPALDAPDALLEAGRRAANPNGDPNATQVDGGDGPTRPFPGGVAKAPRPRKAGRRAQAQGDRVNRDEQDGERSE